MGSGYLTFEDDFFLLVYRPSVPVQLQYFLPAYSSSYPLTHTYTPISSPVSTIRQYPGESSRAVVFYFYSGSAGFFVFHLKMHIPMTNVSAFYLLIFCERLVSSEKLSEIKSKVYFFTNYHV